MVEPDKLLIYGIGRKEDLETARRQINQFRVRHEGRGGIRLISFHDLFPESLGQDVSCIKWREPFTYDEVFSMWGDAYRQLDLISATLPKQAKHLVEIYYHDAAYLLWQALALPAAIARQTEPTCYLVPEALWDQIDGPEKNKRHTLARRLLARVRPFVRRRMEEIRASVIDIATSFRDDIVAMRHNADKAITTGPLVSNMLSGAFVALVLLPRYVIYSTRAAFRIVGRILWISQLFDIGYGMYQQRIKLHALKSALQNSLSRLEGKTQSTSANQKLFVMTVEDGGSGVNLSPALKIAEEFQCRKMRLAIISSSEQVIHEFEQHSHVALSVQRNYTDFLRAKNEYRHLCQEIAQFRDGMTAPPTRHLCNWLLLFGLGMTASNRKVESILNAIDQVAAVGAVLTIYEALPLSIVAGNWANRRQVPWIGFFPILVGDRPDGHHFPAPKHLVYGEQLRDMIISDGHPFESAVVVGSPTYDVFVGRDDATDRLYCDTEFPGSRGRKLVVVATEAFADPLVEIGPVLATLGDMDGVFVVIKVHPSDSVAFFEQYVGSLPRRDNIQVVGACDLGALLHTADLLICIISNIIISAAVLGTPTLVCDFSNKRRVIDFVAAGLCRGCFDPTDVRASVERLLFDPTEEARVREMLALGVRRFNGPSDGKGAWRIVDYTLARADKDSMHFDERVA